MTVGHHIKVLCKSIDQDSGEWRVSQNISNILDASKYKLINVKVIIKHLHLTE